MRKLFKKSKVGLIIFICSILTLAIVGVVAYGATKSSVNISVYKAQVNVGEEFTVTYTIQPKDLFKLDASKAITLSFSEGYTHNVEFVSVNVVQEANNKAVYNIIDSNNQITFNYNYNYYNDSGNNYKANPIIVNITYKAINAEPSKTNIGEGNVKLYYFIEKEENVKNETIPFTNKSMEFIRPEVKTKVSLQVSDSKGDIDNKFESDKLTPTDSGVYIKNNISTSYNKPYYLHGKSNVNFEFNSTTDNYIRYKFLNSDSSNMGNRDGEILLTENTETGATFEVEFPSEVGTYYIIYETGKKEADNYKSSTIGIYGPFIVNEGLSLTRDIKYVEKGKFELIYSIKPKDIEFKDVYRSVDEINKVIDENTYKTSLVIKELKLDDVITDQLSVVSQIIQSGDKKYEYTINSENGEHYLSGKIEGDITYNLDQTSTDKMQWKYSANPIVIRLRVELNDTDVNVISLVDDTAKLSYEDITMDEEINRPTRVGIFDTLTLEIPTSNKISGQDVYDGHNRNIKINPEITVVADMNYQIGTRFDVCSEDAVFSIKLPENIKYDSEQFKAYLYEVTVDEVSPKEIFTYESTDSNNNKSYILTNENVNNITDAEGKVKEDIILSSGKRYIVVYNIEFNQLGELDDDNVEWFIQSNIWSKSANNSDSKNMKLIQGSELPDLF